MKNIHRDTSYDVKSAKVALKIMQSIFLEGKQQKQIVKEIGYSKGYISRIIASLDGVGLVARDKQTDLYYVPVETLITGFAEQCGGYNDKEIEKIIEIVRMRGKIISVEPLKEKNLENAKIIRSYPPLLFMVLLSLGFRETERYNDYDQQILWRFLSKLLLIVTRDFVKSVLTEFFQTQFVMQFNESIKKFLPETPTIFIDAMKEELENHPRFKRQFSSYYL